MNDTSQISEEQRPSGGRLRFSVRDLLRLMVVVSIALGTAAGMARSDHISWFWSWVACGAIVVAWYYGRWNRLLKVSVGRSVWWYILSLMMPAFRLDADIIVGALPWWFSYMFGIDVVYELLAGPPPPSTPYSIGLTLPLMCLAGAVANTLMVLSWIGFFFARRRRRSVALFRWAARVAAGLMVACVLPFVLSGGPTVIYPGYVLWLASAVVLGPVGRSENGLERS
jgi:hypothetical protein